jgi:2,4-dienoyl-CoA reductase-like NADH-dependent reductase (Old Yellow Enzyme family)
MTSATNKINKTNPITNSQIIKYFLNLELDIMSHNPQLLSPFTLPNGTVLKNRVLMAPMTTCTGFFDGTVTSELVEYYRARAGSIGTVIVECCFIDRQRARRFLVRLASTTTAKLTVWPKSPMP